MSIVKTHCGNKSFRLIFFKKVQYGNGSVIEGLALCKDIKKHIGVGEYFHYSNPYFSERISAISSFSLKLSGKLMMPEMERVNGPILLRFVSVGVSACIHSENMEEILVPRVFALFLARTISLSGMLKVSLDITILLYVFLLSLFYVQLAYLSISKGKKLCN